MIKNFNEFINESTESNTFKKFLLKYGASKEIFWDGSEMRIYPKEYTEIANEQYPFSYLYQIAKESKSYFLNMAVGSAQQNISQILIVAFV